MLAAPLAALLAGAALQMNEDFHMVVPVPLHKNRLRARGFNQSLLLARELLRLWRPPSSAQLDYLSLTRLLDTRSQIELTEKERASNVKGAFTVKNKADFCEKKVLLIDDVYTTGSTIKECSKVLSECTWMTAE